MEFLACDFVSFVVVVVVAFTCRLGLPSLDHFRWCKTGWRNFSNGKIWISTFAQNMVKLWMWNGVSPVASDAFALPNWSCFRYIRLLYAFYFLSFVSLLFGLCRFFNWCSCPRSLSVQSLLQWKCSEWPEKKNSLPLRLWHGMAWHGVYGDGVCVCKCVSARFRFTKCFEPDAQMHLHLICVTCTRLFEWLMRVLNCVLWRKITNTFRRQFSSLSRHCRRWRHNIQQHTCFNVARLLCSQVY